MGIKGKKTGNIKRKKMGIKGMKIVRRRWVRKKKYKKMGNV